MTHRQRLSAPIAAIEAWSDGVIVATRTGHLWQLDPATLAPKLHLTPAADFAPQDLSRNGDFVWLTTHAGKGSGGSLLRVKLSE